MKKVGILTCSNTTQDLGCSSFKCLESVYSNGGEFKRHEEHAAILAEHYSLKKIMFLVSF